MKVKNISLSIIISILASQYAYSADLQKGAGYFKQNKYNDAAQELGAISQVSPETMSQVNLTLGMTFQHSARLHAEFSEHAIDMQIKYLKLVLSDKGKSRSKYASLYISDAYSEQGQYKKAIDYINLFKTTKNISAADRQIAEIKMAAVLYRSGKKSEADKILAGINSRDSDVMSEKAAAYSMDDKRQKDALKIISGIDAKNARSSRIGINKLKVMVRTDNVTDALKAAQEISLDGVVQQEKIDATKEIRFYDVSIFSVLSELYNKAAIAYLKKAVADDRFKDISNYYLAEAYFLGGDAVESAKYINSYLKVGKPIFLNKIKILQSLNDYQSGDKKSFNKIIVNEASGPAMIADLLQGCARSSADCAGGEKVAVHAVEGLQGGAARTLNIALGQYYLKRQRYDLAVNYLEEGRDKSRKNNIESNDPTVMVNTAEAYGANKLYSESLEIYFEMSKQFPVVRQIQDSLQGIYSTEQKSSGDVKIF